MEPLAGSGEVKRAPRPSSECDILESAGLRPTAQRRALARLLFQHGPRHITAEMLFEEVTQAKVPTSLATVYNTLNQLTDLGLLRRVSVDGSKTYYDTNVSEHQHFFLENNRELIDIPDAQISLGDIAIPDGYEISKIDVVVRLRKKA